MAQPFKHPKTGIYYIRRKVPDELVPLLGREFKRSLGTKHLAEAKPLYAEQLRLSEEAYQAARKRLRGEAMLTHEQMHAIASEWLAQEQLRLETTKDLTEWLFPISFTGVDTPDGYAEVPTWASYAQCEADDGQEFDYAAILRPEIEKIIGSKCYPSLPDENASWAVLLGLMTPHLKDLSARALAYHEGRLDRPLTALMPTPQVVNIRAKQPTNQKTIWDALDAYATTKRLTGVARSNEGTITSYRGMIQTFVELSGVLALDKITKEVIYKHREHLNGMPSAGKGVRKLAAPLQIERAKTDQLPTLSQQTIRNHLRCLSSLLSHAQQRGWLSENVVETSGVMRLINQAIRGGTKAKRRDYTQDELRRIFASEVFADTKSDPLHRKFGDAAHWLPLLMYYTGARREELAQLKANEVKPADGLYCLDIMTNGDDDERGVKTESSRREIPLHQDLIDKGFLEYVQTLPVDGQLFPKLKPCPDGYYGTAFGKEWGKYLKAKVELKTTASPSHGFRHTFKTLCRLSGMPEDVMDAIAGHAANTVARGYGVMPLARMAEELKKFPSIPS